MATLEDVLRQDWLYPHPERLVTSSATTTPDAFSRSRARAWPISNSPSLCWPTLRGMPQIYSVTKSRCAAAAILTTARFPRRFSRRHAECVRVSGRTAEQAEVHDWVASFFQFRDHHPAMANGEQQDVFVTRALVLVRTANLQKGCGAGNGEHYLVALNSSDQPAN